MRIPIVRGIIDRRILVNFRIDPDVMAKVLPRPFRPILIRGAGIAGVCLIRLKCVRPRFLPGFLGISSENAAHRFAVEWDDGDELRKGVFIPRRDTSSQLNALAGGRLFPGIHHHARFRVREDGEKYQVSLDSDDGETHITIAGSVASDLPAGSIFNSTAEASKFFQQGNLGFSAAVQPGQFDGLELRCFDWHVASLEVSQIQSSYFENRRLFPAGSVQFDCALVMRNIKHEWHDRGALHAGCACHDQ